MKALQILFVLAVISLTLAQNYSSCPGQINNHTLIKAKPKLINSTKNGKRFMITDPLNPLIHMRVAVLSGTAYEMGYAMGVLFKDDIKEFVKKAMMFAYEGAAAWVNDIPPWIGNIPTLTNKQKIGLGFAYERIATAHYTPQRFLDELYGISNATGIDFDQLWAVNLFPELTRAVCSIMGAWGKATPNGGLLQLRALDYLAQAPFNNLATVTIYHPTEPGSKHFANIGWPGMIGTLAGYNGEVGIGERLWSNTNDKIQTIFGEPWMFVLRDVVQFGTNLKDSIQILRDANRTYNIRLGVGSKSDNELRGIQYSHLFVDEYTDKNWSSPFSPNHPQMDGILFWYKQGDDMCMTQTIQGNYGKITPETIYRIVAPKGKTGDTITAVYAYQTNEMFVSMASNFLPAYNNPFFYFNMTEWFSVSTNDEPMETEEAEEEVQNEDSDVLFL